MTQLQDTQAPVIEIEHEAPRLDGTLSEVNALRQRPENWDGYGAAKPDGGAIAHALLWIRQMSLDAVEAIGQWMAPHVGANSEGNVVFEWWNGRKKLTVYVAPQTVEFVKVWGLDIINDMADGSAMSSAERRALWTWFMDQMP